MLWEDLEGAGGEGGGRGVGMGKTCETKAFSFQCMTKFTTNKKIKINKIKLKKKSEYSQFKMLAVKLRRDIKLQFLANMKAKKGVDFLFCSFYDDSSLLKDSMESKIDNTDFHKDRREIKVPVFRCSVKSDSLRLHEQ